MQISLSALIEMQSMASGSRATCPSIAVELRRPRVGVQKIELPWHNVEDRDCDACLEVDVPRQAGLPSDDSKLATVLSAARRLNAATARSAKCGVEWFASVAVISIGWVAIARHGGLRPQSRCSSTVVPRTSCRCRTPNAARGEVHLAEAL